MNTREDEDFGSSQILPTNQQLAVTIYCLNYNNYAGGRLSTVKYNLNRTLNSGEARYFCEGDTYDKFIVLQCAVECVVS